MEADAATAAALFAVDPAGLGGVCLRAPACSARDAWLALLRGILPPGTPVRRMPVHVSDAALLGGLDLAATLQAGRPVAQAGLLQMAHGGVLVLPMAERMTPGTAARLCSVLDTKSVALQRDGLDARYPAHIGLVALDEGIGEDEVAPGALRDRLALQVVLDGSDTAAPELDWSADDVAQARARLADVVVDDGVARTLCAAAIALGVDSMRAPVLALRVARAAAALAGAQCVEDDHVALAARLVLAPRATRVPQAPADNASATAPEDSAQDPQEQQAQDQPAPPPKPQPDAHPHAGDTDVPEPEQPPGQMSSSLDALERVLEAVQAFLPAGLLAALAAGRDPKTRAGSAGRAGTVQKSRQRGRPIGARRGEPRNGQRLNVLETLRAAAPWQRLRQSGQPAKHIQVRKEDFHVTRLRQRSQTTTVFVVDASGSAALHRLAEAKGAVELLLADCYVRRDSVAVVVFRGKQAEVLLAPTRSLARAKRSLAGLPGGGGTPLASGIDAARELGEQICRRGETPTIVLLTDGQGNIARDGSPGRRAAAADAQLAARALRLAGLRTLLLDTSPQPQAAAQALAADMGAHYVPLPYANARTMSQAVRALGTAPGPAQ